ncbi:MAG: helix-turn-helix domain-containing protein [Cyclobacteriaceae bacterium]|nr:helix-turn-helix domain-containing protein [Cyclobacteriaceae bacterium]
MTIPNSIQSAFLEQIRKRLQPNVSFADALADALSISRDSAYRRIRGETVLSLDEVKILCNQYGVSVDNIVSGAGEMVSFHYRMVGTSTFTFDKWLRSILDNLETLMAYPDKQLIYFAKDIPVFYYFNSPLIGPFKMFFWMNSVLHDRDYRGVKFRPESVSLELIAIGEKIWQRYTETPRVEIWSDETLNVTIRQIEFYHECGFFDDPKYAVELCDEYSLIIKEIKEWATNGYKETPKTKFDLYKNDLLIADNTIFFRMGDQRMTFIPYNTMNILTTTHEVFCKQTEDYLMNLISKSILISTSGERDRNKFFNQMEDKIQQLKARIK